MKVKEFSRVLMDRIVWPVYDRLYYVYFIVISKVFGSFLRKKFEKEHEKGAYDSLEETAPPGEGLTF